MATKAINYSISVGSKISGDHTEAALIKGYYFVSCASDYSADKKTAVSVFSLPSLDLAKTLVLTSLNLSASTSISEGASGGHSYAFIIDGTAYTCDSNGYLVSGGITCLNNYKAKNGAFPDVTIQVTSWVSRPPANEDGTIQEYFNNFQSFVCTAQATIQGGSLILRPNADISAEHTIPSGFTGVYQLLNEEVADDAATRIGDNIEAKLDEKVKSTLTSVVSLEGGSFSKKNIVLMRPVSRHNIINPTMNGSASIACSVIVGDISNTFTDNVSTEGYVTNEKWILLSKSPVVQEVISYAKTNKVLPEIRLSLCTDLSSSGSAIKSGGKASAYITQAYLEIIYEDALGIGISHKVDGEWKQAQAAYQKQNGIWTKIEEDECRALLASHLFKSVYRTSVPTISGNFTYNGSAHSPTISGYDGSLVGISGTTSAVTSGTYTVICSIKNKEKYVWPDGSTADKQLTWKINPVSVAIPTVLSNPLPTGSVVSPTWSGYDSSIMTIGGVTSAIEEGMYTATFDLRDKVNYCWADGTNTTKSVVWSVVMGIEQVLIDFVYTENADGTYTITDWKGTYQGQPSTEIIIPDDPRIVL